MHYHMDSSLSHCLSEPSAPTLRKLAPILWHPVIAKFQYTVHTALELLTPTPMENNQLEYRAFGIFPFAFSPTVFLFFQRYFFHHLFPTIFSEIIS